MQEDIFLRMGRRVKEAREECGLTQQELAEQTGRGLRHLQDIEKGGKIRLLICRHPISVDQAFRLMNCFTQMPRQ